MKRLFALWALLPIASLVVFASVVAAHESRPAYLEITEQSPGLYEVIWRTPVNSGMRLPVTLVFPDDTRNIKEPVIREFPDSLLERRLIETGTESLTGKRIDFVGLEATITDVLVRIELLNHDYSTVLVKPSKPWVDVAATKGKFAVASTYLIHGVEHIIFGFDHLLFVLALVLIVKSFRILLFTITSFTIAHSITLALSTLGIVHVPRAPVEAVIALSILLVALEIAREDKGHTGMTVKWPWVVAFLFGLLHGFGFASAITEIGLPQNDIPIALFSFNLGVEMGQLLFIGAVLCLITLTRLIRIKPVFYRYVLPTTTYAIGGLAAFWFIQRLMGFWR